MENYAFLKWSVFSVQINKFLANPLDKIQYHTVGKRPLHPDYREVDPFICESTAYRRLQERDPCEQGLIPDFLGEIKNIDPGKPPISTHL